MTEICPVCKGELVYYSSDFGTTRYYCSNCKSFHTIWRSLSPEEKPVQRPIEKKIMKPRKKAGVKKIQPKRVPKKKTVTKKTAKPMKKKTIKKKK